MRRYYMKKILILTVCIAMLLNFSAVSAAASQSNDTQVPISPRYVEISMLYISFAITTSGRADCYADVHTAKEFSCTLTVELQKRVGSSWETKKTWTSTDDGFGFTYVDEPWYVTRGDYQLKVTAEITDASGVVVERPVEYSTIKTY
jgi:hypothetical protein